MEQRTTRETLLRIYEETETIAVVGSSATEGKPGHDIPQYLQSQGYRIVPVNPRGGEILVPARDSHRSLYPFGIPPMPENLDATQNKAFGVLHMTLHADSYDYGWVPVAGEPAFEDAGTVACS